MDAVKLLGASRRQAESGDYFVAYHQRIGPVAEVADCLEVAFDGRDYAHVGGDGLDDYRCNVVFVFGECGFYGVDVVIRDDDG